MNLKQFAAEYQRQTGFDLMERQEGETARECAERNIQWLRDWAQETADHLERKAP